MDTMLRWLAVPVFVVALAGVGGPVVAAPPTTADPCEGGQCEPEPAPPCEGGCPVPDPCEGGQCDPTHNHPSSVPLDPCEGGRTCEGGDVTESAPAVEPVAPASGGSAEPQAIRTLPATGVGTDLALLGAVVLGLGGGLVMVAWRR